MKYRQFCKTFRCSRANHLTFTDHDIHNTHCESHVSVGKDGLACGYWTDYVEFDDTVDFFPDASIEDAQNFCRLPFHFSQPWCYPIGNDNQYAMCDTNCKHIIGGE